MATKQAQIKQSETIAVQETGFKTGNEMAALAATQINYHIMGYFPITPSTEIAEYLDQSYAAGENSVVLIPGDGEHGAAGICYGASIGARTFNATSSQGLLYALEQLPVQSATRFPMVLNVVTRTISAPIDIQCDHSDLYFVLNAGWIILMARTSQAVYDMNIIAVRLGEHPEVRLPVIVSYDGFITSHQKRKVSYFKDAETVRSFVGPFVPTTTALDPRQPVTIGGLMNPPEKINTVYQLHLAMEAARRVLPEIIEEYYQLTGRRYTLVEGYRMEDAEVGILVLNSAAETAKEAVDRLRAQGQKVGVISPTVLRPFPAEEIRQMSRRLRALVIADRADSYGGNGGNLAHEVKSALYDDPENRVLCLSRIFGVGGKEFTVDDAVALFEQGQQAIKGRKPVLFDYYGQNPGDESYRFPQGLPALRPEEVNLNLVSTRQEDGKVIAKAPSPRDLMKRVKRFTPGHSACPGCGIFPAINQFLQGIEGDVVVLFATGCSEVVSSGYPLTSHRLTFVHNLFQNGAATLSGLVEAFKERQRRGEIPAGEDITFVMVAGDGSMDIGMGPTIGTALRNHKMIVLEYDNEGYMNTGSQLSYSTPFGHMTATSHVGPKQMGKRFHHKDTPQIMAATNIPYVFTGVEGPTTDLQKKAAKAQWYAKNEGMVYGKMLIACPLNWRSEEAQGQTIVQKAVDSCFFPLYEVERGITTITYDPEAKKKRVAVAEWLKTMGKTRHLLRPEYKEQLAAFEAEVDRRWQRLKAKHENPLL